MLRDEEEHVCDNAGHSCTLNAHPEIHDEVIAADIIEKNEQTTLLHPHLHDTEKFLLAHSVDQKNE